MKLHQEKCILRSKMLYLRKQLDRETVGRSNEAGKRLAEYLANSYRQGVVTAYWSVANEFSTRGLLECFWSLGMPVGLPVIMGDDTMEFYRIDSVSALQDGKFGIPTPAVTPGNRVDLKDISAMVVPGVAFDLQGNRLGMGKGYFDRYLAQLPPKVPTIGAAFEFQIVPVIPVGTTDSPVRLLWTECRNKIGL